MIMIYFTKSNQLISCISKILILVLKFLKIMKDHWFKCIINEIQIPFSLLKKINKMLSKKVKNWVKHVLVTLDDGDTLDSTYQIFSIFPKLKSLKIVQWEGSAWPNLFTIIDPDKVQNYHGLDLWSRDDNWEFYDIRSTNAFVMVVANGSSKILQWSELKLSTNVKDCLYGSDYLYVFYYHKFDIKIEKQYFEAHEDYLNINKEDVKQDCCLIIHSKYIDEVRIFDNCKLDPPFWPTKRLFIKLENNIKYVSFLWWYLYELDKNVEIVFETCGDITYESQGDFDSLYKAVF